MSTKEYGCFFCEGKSSDYEGKCAICNKPVNISNHLLTSNISGYKFTKVLGRGFFGWTVRAHDDFQEFAIKIIPTHRLSTKKDSNKEVRALVECSNHRNIARFWKVIDSKLDFNGNQVDVKCLVFEYISNAMTLNNFLKNHELELTKHDVVSLLSGIISGLARLHNKGMWHDDLHDDNILIKGVDIDEQMGNEKYEAKLIDFGSVKPLANASSEDDDYFYLGKHINNIVSHFESLNRKKITPSDRIFADYLKNLAHIVLDRNPSRRNLTPLDIREKVKKSYNECTQSNKFPSFKEMQKQCKVTLLQPLSNINALSLAPQDISLLFRDSLNWKNQLTKYEPVIINGPRGCGKTMLLRYLSVFSRVRPNEGDNIKTVSNRLKNDSYIAFMLSMGLIRTPFVRSFFTKLCQEDKQLTEEFCREYLNTHFICEIISTVVWLGSEKIINFTQDDINILQTTLSKLLNESQVYDLKYLAEKMDKRIVDLSNLHNTSDYVSTCVSNDNILQELAKSLKSIPFFQEKEIWFLIDDYSPTVLPKIAQEAYNSVLFRLSTEIRVKISAEGEGPILEDTLGRKYKEGRELFFVNLGEVYFNSSEKVCRKFFEEILTARFNETCVGSLDIILNKLGEHPHEKNFGKYILARHLPGLARFYGFGLICKLCSGDVSFIINLLDEIIKNNWDDDKKITGPQQDKIIKKFANRQLTDLRSISTHGTLLYEFAFNTGSLLKKYLLKSPKDHQTDERLRLEIEGSGGLSNYANEILHLLLRHSILIMGGTGKSRNGLPTRKYYFRRLFAPCFPFSIARSGCVAITNDKFEKWIKQPEKILDKVIDDANEIDKKNDLFYQGEIL